MSEGPNTTTSPSFWERLGRGLGRVFRFLLRLVLVLIIGVALGVGLYFGALALYNQYILPVQVHAIRIDILEARQKQAEQQSDRRLADLQSRLDSLEVRADDQREAIGGVRAELDAVGTVQAAHAEALAAVAQLQADLAEAQANVNVTGQTLEGIQADVESLRMAQDALQADLDEANAAVATVTTDQDAIQESLRSLQAGQREAQSALEAVQSTLETVGSEADRLSRAMASNQQALSALDAEFYGDGALAELRRELTLVKVMESLTRARLLLVQNNLGLARSEIEAGRDRLVALQSQVPSYQVEAVSRIVAGLDAALEQLPDAPVAATDELEGAWQLLSQGLPEEPAVTATPEAASASSPTPESTPEATPSPAVTVEASPTPEATAATTPSPTGTPEATVSPTPTATP